MLLRAPTTPRVAREMGPCQESESPVDLSTQNAWESALEMTPTTKASPVRGPSDAPAPAVAGDDLFAAAARAERAVRRSVPGRLLLVVIAVASPIDLFFDARMGAALANLDVHPLLPALLFSFLYLGLRVQLLLFVATSEYAVDGAIRKTTTTRARALACLLEWPLALTDLSPARVLQAWAPFGLQCSRANRNRFWRSLALEVAYAPVVCVCAPALVVYGSWRACADVLFGEPDAFWRSPAAEQVRAVRAMLITMISTSFTAWPQIAIQAYVYLEGDVELSAYAERLVVASICLSFLMLARALCGLAASWRKIVFTWQRVNRNLDETTFNAILHECADLATAGGDAVQLGFADGHPTGCDLPLYFIKSVQLVSAASAAETARRNEAPAAAGDEDGNEGPPAV